MKKKFCLLSVVGCFLFLIGCSTQELSNTTNLEEINKKNELNLNIEFSDFEKEIGLEKIRSYETFSNLMSQVLDERFIKMRENKINEEAINEDVVLKCANRAFEIANLPNEDNKLLIVEFISKIDKIDYKMNRELILKLFENLYLLGSLDEISLLEKDSKLLLTNYYIATTAKNAISYNDDFSYEERLKLLDFLSSFTNLFYKLNSVTNDTESVSVLLTSSYDKTREGIKEIVLKNK